MTGKWTRIFFLFLSIGVLNACAEPLPVLGRLPEFSFQDQSGRPVTREDLIGKVWVADFIYTACADVCPVLTQKMRSLLQDPGIASRPEVMMVSLTVDPEVDTVERLSHYAKSFEADPSRWLFLTGETVAVQKTIVEGFKMPSQKMSAFEWMHGEKFVLIDRRGAIRGYFDADPEGLSLLKRRMLQLARE